MTHDWAEYYIDYKKAGDLLLKNAIETRRRGRMVFPTIFLYRHYIELILKEIILNCWEYLGIRRAFPKEHNIYNLWKTCREYLEQADELVAPQSIETEEDDKKYYDALGADLNKFAEIDPDSQNSRYPVDNKGNPIPINNKQLGNFVRELPELIDRISYKLDGISVGIWQNLEDKYDEYRNM